MKKLLISFSFFLHCFFSFSQPLISGDYEIGLKLAFNSKTNKITGYYQNATSWDDDLKIPRFTCVFYLEGIYSQDSIVLKTYYPIENSNEYVFGNFDIINNKTISIKLQEEHGGCWNVLHFADSLVQFNLLEAKNWIEINYIAANKAYLYKEKSDQEKTNLFLVKGDFVCIYKIENSWAYCSFYGSKTSTGWIKIEDLNKF